MALNYLPKSAKWVKDPGTSYAFVATGGVSGSSKSTTLSAFLGVAVPSVPASNTGLVWFSPSVPAQKPFLRVHVAQL